MTESAPKPSRTYSDTDIEVPESIDLDRLASFMSSTPKAEMAVMYLQAQDELLQALTKLHAYKVQMVFLRLHLDYRGHWQDAVAALSHLVEDLDLEDHQLLDISTLGPLTEGSTSP